MLRQELQPIISEPPRLPRLAFRLGRRLSSLLLCLLLLATVVSGMLATDWSEVLRRVVILHLRDRTGREVRLGSARVSLRDGLVLSDLTIYPRGAYRHPLFRVKQLAVRVDPLCLQLAPNSPLSAIRRVELSSPYVYLTRNARGAWNIDDLLRGNGTTAPSRDRFSAEVTVRNGEVVYQDKVGVTPGYPLNEHLVGISLHLRPTPGGYMPFRLTARTVSGHLHSLSALGGLRLDTQRMLCDIQFTDANLKFVRQFLNKNIPLQVQAGRGDGRWQLLLARDPVTQVFHTTLGVQADVRDVRATLKLARETIPCVVSHGQLRCSMELVELIDMRGQFGGVPATISGTISTHKNTVLALHVQANHAPAQRVAQLIPGAAKAPCRWGGLLDATVDVTGTAQNPRVVGHVAGLAMRTGFGNYSQLACDVEYTDPALVCSRITSSGFGGTLAGDLWLSLNSKDPKQNVEALFYGQATNINPRVVNTQLRARQVADRPHQSVSPLETLTGCLSGPVTVRVSRQPDAPGCLNTTVLASCTGTAAITAPVALQGEVDASLRINIDTGTARDSTSITTDLERIQVRTTAGVIRAHGTVDADDHLALTVQGSALDLAEIGRRAGRTDLAGSGYLLGRVTGALDTPDFTGSIHLKHGVVAGHAFADLTGEVTATTWPMKIALAHACLTEGDSSLLVAGTLAPVRKGQWLATLSLEMPRTSLAALGASLGIDIPVKGYVEGKVELTGLPDTLRGHGQLLCRRPTLLLRPGPGGTLECDRLAVDFTVAHGAVDLHDAELVYQGTPVSITGKLPITTEGGAPVAISLQAHTPSFDVGIITELLNSLPLAARPDVGEQLTRLQHQVHGAVALDATISGRLKAGQAFTVEALQRTLEIRGTLHETKPLIVAGVPYRKLVVGLAYRPGDRVITLSEFTLQRTGAEGAYTIGLAPGDDPGTLRLAATDATRDEIDMKLVLKTDNINQLRRDALTIATTTRQYPLFVPLGQIARAVPTPFSGRGQISVSLAGAADAPCMRAELALSDVVISNNAVPDIDGAVTFDPAPREITLEQLKIGGRADLEKHPELQGVSVDISGKISLPVPGKEAEGGPLNLSVDAQNVNLGLLGLWMHNDGLKAFSGEATIVAAVNSTTAHPHLVASVDINHPTVEGMTFDSLTSAIVTVDEDGIWIGNWHAKGDSAEDGDPSTATGGLPVVIGAKLIYPDDGAVLQFARSTRAGKPVNKTIEPLQIYGYLPLHWSAPFMPEIPADKDMFLTVRLPKQGLSFLRAYLPKDITTILPNIDKEDGVVDGSLVVGGKLRPEFKPEIQSGSLHLDAPLLTLNSPTSDLPSQLRKVSLNLGFHLDERTHRTNVVEVKDLSAIFDRPNEKKKNNLFSILKIKNKPKLPTTGSIIAQGRIMFDPQQLFTPEGKLLPLADISNRLNYDLYMKTVRAPFRWKETFQDGTVTAFLHLGNRNGEDGQPLRPLLEGLVYAENATVSSANSMGASQSITYPMDPELSIALLAGKGNEFTLSSPAFSAALQFVPTSLPAPISNLEKENAALPSGQKIPIDKDYMYVHNAAALQQLASEYPVHDSQGIGTWGIVTGRLSAPTIDVNFQIDPPRSLVQLPGGILAISNGSGSLLKRPDSDLSLPVVADATGSMDDYTLSAHIEGDLWQHMQSIGDCIKLTSTSTVPGLAPLTPDDIYSRLIGVSDVLAALKNQNAGLTPWAPLAQKGVTNLAVPKFSEMLRGKFFGQVLDTLSYDPWHHDSTQADPSYTYSVARFSTVEFPPRAHLLAFRLGGTYGFSNPETWQLWMNARLPSLKNFDHLEMSINTSNKRDLNLNLQYRIQFEPLGRKRKAKTENKDNL